MVKVFRTHLKIRVSAVQVECLHSFVYECMPAKNDVPGTWYELPASNVFGQRWQGGRSGPGPVDNQRERRLI